MGRPRLATRLALAAFAAAVLAVSVYTTFERVRVRPRTTSITPEAGSIWVRLPEEQGFGDQPVALILGLRGGTQPAHVLVELDGREIARVDLDPGRQTRVDRAIARFPSREASLLLTGSQPGWALTYVELATVHGHSSGAASFVIAPAGRARSGTLPLWMVVSAFVLLAVLQPRFDWPGRGWRLLHRAFAGLVVFVFALSLGSRAVSPYVVFLSLQTFVLCLAVLYAAPALWLVGRFAPRRAAGELPWRELPPLPGWREMLAVSAALSVVILIVLHVQVRNMFSVPDLGDPLFSMWRMAWVQQQLAANPSQLFDANIFYPSRGTLTYSDAIILPALMAAPLQAAGLHPVVAYNVLLMAAFALSGVTAYVLARSLGLATLPSWGSSLVFALYSFRLDHYSHLELQMTHWIPLALLGTQRLLASGRPWYLALTASAAAAQWYSSLYYGVFLTIYVGVFALVLAASWRAWRRLAGVACALLLAIAIAAPLGLAYTRTQADRGVRSVDSVHTFSATPTDYLRSTDRSALYGGDVPTAEPERALFPGAMPLVLGLAGAWPPLTPTRLAILVSGLVAFDGSLGTNGVWYPSAYRYLSPFRSIRAPARFGLLVGLTLALLAGWSLARWRASRWGRIPTSVAFALVTVVLVADAWPRIELVPVWRDPPPIYDALGRTSGAVLMEYPLSSNPRAFAGNIPFLYFSIWHLTPMINGYSGYLSDTYARLAVSMEGFPGGDTIETLQHLGVTHISVICALDGDLAPRLVPQPEPEKCARTIDQLDRDARVSRLVQANWEGAPALLYALAPHSDASHR